MSVGAAGQGALLDAEPVADEAALALGRGDGQHLLQRRAVAEQPAREQRVQEAREVSDGGGQRVAAGGAANEGSRFTSTSLPSIAT